MSSPTPSHRPGRTWPAFLERFSYQVVVGNIPFLAFLALLSIVYIHNTQRAVAIQKEMNEQQAQLKELRWKYMDRKSQLLNLEMENKVVEKAQELGLKPLALPAYLLTSDTLRKQTSAIGN